MTAGTLRAEKRRMANGTLTIDLGALAANWRALADAAPDAEAGAVVKADGYGLGMAEVARTLSRAGVRWFFVATAEEGATLRAALGGEPQICVFGGYMPGDAALLAENALVPMLNSAEQVQRYTSDLAGHPYGVQLDSGMNRLGMEPGEWADLRDGLGEAKLVMSHLACADEPGDPMNARQLEAFREMTDGVAAPRSLAATGGILLGPEYHFDVVRPGVGLYGGLPFADAQPVVRLSLPVIQVREVMPDEIVGYGATWAARAPTRVATLQGGYADGLIRAMGNRGAAWAGDIACPLVGRVSMDLTTVDVTHLPEVPPALDILGPHQTVDDVADAAGTIGYEILTSLRGRYSRRYVGA